MYVETTKHNTYSYLRRTGEIVSGVVADGDYVWTFEPLKPFSAMPEVDMFILSITEQCNLRCTYCCYSGEYPGNRTHSSLSMSREDINEIYSFIQQTATKRPLHIAFYGGEPLLQYGLVQYAIEKGIEQWGDEVTYSVTTNATLLTIEKIDWLIFHNVKLEISIDGTAMFHDRHRVDQTGKGSFYRVHQALTHIVNNHSEYHNFQLQMTLSSIDDLLFIAKEWNEDSILVHLAPSYITSLAPNFSKGVAKRKYEELKEQYIHLLDIYEQHPDWQVLKAYFNECIALWKERPIMDVGDTVPMSTCMPRNTKLHIDASKQISVCEKISDLYRIGSVGEGVDWQKANELVQAYYNKRVHRCAQCPAIRMCNLCLTAVEFNDEQWNLLCHNECVYARLDMLLFCEMAERRMIA